MIRAVHPGTGTEGRIVGPGVPFSAMSAEDERRMAELFVLHFRTVWRTLRRLGVPSAACDDVAQHVYLIAAARLHQIGPQSARAFLVATAARLAANARRNAKTRAESPDTVKVEQEADLALSPDRLLDERRRRELLDDVLDAMPDELREVLVLFELEGMSTHAIAPALGIPRGTVVSRLRRARELFEQAARRLRARHAPRRGLP